MSGDNWQPGDLALCVRRGVVTYGTTGWSGMRPEIREGACYTVADAGVLPDANGVPNFCLLLVEAQSPADHGGYSATRFRKIHPLSIEERNAEIRLLNTAPAKETV